MAKKSRARKSRGKPPIGPEWLKKKLGAADYARFEEAMFKARTALGKAKKKAEVEGQGVCGSNCWPACGWSWSWQSGGWHVVFTYT